MIATLLVAAALQTAPAVSVTDRIENLNLADDRTCTADGAWCVSLVQEMREGEVVVTPVVRAAGEAAGGEIEAGEVETYQPWTGLVRLADGGFLAGVEAGARSMYSGGGGQASELRLYRLTAAGEPGAAPVLTVPIRGALMIRACFSEADMKQRAGACHDEYGFDATLKTAGGSDALPMLDYETVATAFPRGVSRSADSLEKAPLTKADLFAERDPNCSYQRRFVFDAAAGVYQPDRPLPDCSDYTVP
ncbi:MAG: hypothetical protein Q7J26_06775 [Brevundimonas sp.]|uniref:hypothetical protein n=1 Tax=Brevundimonas sp. TaxID=1871086 RepID=UPI0027165939|nr:hypothetical protein [Brevundimonas sp.]MDO9608212.1 hypothetical protein [Brevundimonas sp.]